MNKQIWSAVVFACLACVPAYAQDFAVEALQTEHLECPLGIDVDHPRLSWRMQTKRDAARQAGYQLLVGTDSAAVVSGRGDVWNTGYVPSGKMLVAYEGVPLKSCSAYFWRVQVTDERGERVWSPVEKFETGLMTEGEWQGCWISDGRKRDHEAAPYFRKQFHVDGDVRSARVYLAVAGLYELYVNGHRVGDQLLTPLYTRYDRHNLYQTWDVTPYLLPRQDNVIGVVLGNGWYNHQALAVWDFDNAPWRNRPAFCLDLRMTLDDGTSQTVSTDLSWRSTDRGPMRKNNIYTGDQYDFNHSMTGWAQPGYEEDGWGGVGLRSVPSPKITSQQSRPIRACREMEAKGMHKFSDSLYVFDFGCNMSGMTRVRLRGEKNTVVRLAHGERLTKEGRLDPSNIDVYYRGDRDKDPFQTDVLTLSGGEDEFMASFSYKGFRYVEVTSSRPIQLEKSSMTAYFVHSDVPRVGEIAASNPLIEGLMSASCQSYLSNLMGHPTDCPQREKNGWTGDGHLAIEAALYNYDGITVYEKWLADHRDEQQPNGVLPDIIPTGGWGYGTDNGLDWTSTIAIIPWNLYLFYGDVRPLSDCYEAIRRYVDYVSLHSVDYLTTWGRGDWVPVSVGSNKELTSSVYYYVDAKILAQAARLLGRKEDDARYSRLAQNIRESINRKFLNSSTGVYASGTQTEQSVPLYWGVVPEEHKALVAKVLNDKVVEKHFHLDVGVLGCKALLNALSENGYAGTAYRVAVQDTYPSWGWWIVNGATTLLENWDLNATRDISDNHMMFGEIGAWFYKGLAGIYPDSCDPGFHHILLRPYFPEGLTSFKASHMSPYGRIESGWTRKGRRVQYRVVVPPNCTATLTLQQHVAGGLQDELLLPPGEHMIQLTLE